MAMRKEPERRYASAEQLADDLRRHLDGRPVLARGDSTVYRAGKFVRRHAAAVAAAAGGDAGAGGGHRRDHAGAWCWPRRERDRAEASSRQARRAVDQFFTRVSEERLLNQPGLHPLRKELLRDARRFYEGFLAERAGDPAARRRAGGGPEPARPDHRGDRLARRGRRPVPAGDRALGRRARGRGRATRSTGRSWPAPSTVGRRSSCGWRAAATRPSTPADAPASSSRPLAARPPRRVRSAICWARSC